MSRSLVPNGYFIEVSVVQDSILQSHGGSVNYVLKGTRIKIRRVTEKGDFTYDMEFPQGIFIAREDMDGTGELIHPEDVDAIKLEISNATRSVHPNRNSKAREELRAALLRVLNTTARPKSVGIQRGTTKEYRTIGTRTSLE